jgi:Tfp pilus assembly protein PilF
VKPARCWLPGILVVLLAIAPFAGSARHPFVYDDQAQVARNALVRSLDPRTHLAQRSVTHGRVEWYRPLTTYSFAVEYAAAGLDPRPYHLTNLGLHAAASVLLLAIGRRVLGPGGGFLAAALFAVHAVHTEAVVPVFGRADLLAACCVLLAWLVTLDRRAGRGWRAVLAGALGFLGLLSKENAIALPALVLITDLAGLTREGRRGPRGGPGGRLLTVLCERRWLYASLVAAAAAALALRQVAVGGLAASGSGIRFIENPLIDAGLWPRIATGLWVMLLYLRLFLLPVPLSADYSYNAVPVIESWSDPRPWAMAVAGGALSYGLLLWPRLRRPAWLLGAAGALLLPVSNLILPIGTIMAERLLYLPSAALCVYAGALAGALRRDDGAGHGESSHGWLGTERRLPIGDRAVVAAILAVHVWIGVARTDVWSDEERLFAAAVSAAPASAKARVLLATVLMERGAVARGEPLLREAVAIVPAYPEAWNLLGTIHLGRDELDAASGAFGQAVGAAPGYAPALANLGTVLRRQGRRDEAERLLRRAVAADPTLATAWVNLALLAELRGDVREAVALYTRAHALDPSLEVARARAAELSAGVPRAR